MAEKAKAEKNPTCGLVMPISAMDGYTKDHWSSVKQIITEAVLSIAEPKFAVRLVSDADEVRVIHKTIVQSLYSSEIVICDVSGKNPNVMFELGLRLAFDKATVIIKDDETKYSFDTGPIEHIEYPHNLEYQKVVAFKTLLANKVKATYNASNNDPEHSPFLKSFGSFKVAGLDENVVSPDTAIMEMLRGLSKQVTLLDERFKVQEPNIARDKIRSVDTNTVHQLMKTFITEEGLIEPTTIVCSKENTKNFIDFVLHKTNWSFTKTCDVVSDVLAGELRK